MEDNGGNLDDEDERRLLERTGEVGRLLNGLLRFLRGKNPAAASPLTDNRPPTTDNSCI
jgi:hypothetical protein